MAKKKIVIGSEEQENFWKEVVNFSENSPHIILDAKAGVGKSFSCKEAIKRLPSNLKIIYAAFNRHVVKEFSKDVPENVKVATMHSLGYESVRNAYGGVVALEHNKLWDIVENLLGGLVDDTSVVVRMAELCKYYVLDGKNKGELEWLAEHHNISIDDDMVYKAIPSILEISASSTSCIDYGDMIWLPVIHKLPVTECDILFIDEAQDLNICQQELATLICPKGRIVVIGDRTQACYGFSGADTKSMQHMEDKLANTPRGVMKMPLTITRRCPKSHVSLANKVVPDIAAMKTAKSGEIKNLSNEEAPAKMKAGDMVICRTNAPLVGVLYNLIKDGKKAIIRGREIGSGLISFIKKFRTSDVFELIKKINSYKEKEYLKLCLNEKRNGSAIVNLCDKCDTIKALSENCDNTNELIKKIQNIFAEVDGNGKEKKSIILSSIHRAKGLEAGSVFILEPHLLPHPMATQEWEIEQERNIAYIAVTRSKDKLYFVGETPKMLR